jgi:hypothetical protein
LNSIDQEVAHIPLYSVESTEEPSISNETDSHDNTSEASARATSNLVKLYDQSFTVVVKVNNSALDQSLTAVLDAVELAIVAEASLVISSLAALTFEALTVFPLASVHSALTPNVIDPVKSTILG